ncbi:hypothetical protein V5F72_20880 [Xanthobacter flavus]|uniref:hypothetical protein n=1 Tax=Xanthobacter flavus TaxID=281 RepID=UPI00372C4DA4
MAADLSRRELYDLLWAERTADVARKLGLDEWILRETCKRHRVPVPPPSYWRNIEAGKVPRRAVFVDTLDPAVECIGFGLSARPRIEVEERPAARRLPPPTRVKPRKREPNPRSIEWEPVKKPHAALAATANALRRTRADGGIVSVRGEGVAAMRLGTFSIERAIFILDRILGLLEGRGLACAVTGDCLRASTGVDGVRFRLREKIGRAPYEPSVHGRQNPYSWHPRFIEVPTGQLAFSIEEWGGDRLRQNWRDNTLAHLEAQTAPICDVLLQWLEHIRLRRLERERQSRLWRRAEQNEELQRAREKREREREALLQEMVNRRVRADRLRGWIAATGEPSAPETTRMLGWARVRLAELEHGLDPHSFAELLRERQLFPDVDPLAPLPEDPD